MCLSFFLGVFIDKFHGVTLGKPAISPSSESPHHCILLLWWFCPSPSESGVLRSPSSRLIQLCNLFTALKHCPLFCSTYCTSINRPQAYITACWVRRCLDFFHPQQIRISGGRILGGFLSEPFQVSVSNMHTDFGFLANNVSVVPFTGMRDRPRCKFQGPKCPAYPS